MSTNLDFQRAFSFGENRKSALAESSTLLTRIKIFVRNLMDLVCTRVNKIDMTYPEDERENCDNHNIKPFPEACLINLRYCGRNSRMDILFPLSQR